MCRRSGGGNNNNVGVVSISVVGVDKGGGSSGGAANGEWDFGWNPVSVGLFCCDACCGVVSFVFCVCQCWHVGQLCS